MKALSNSSIENTTMAVEALFKGRSVTTAVRQTANLIWLSASCYGAQTTMISQMLSVHGTIEKVLEQIADTVSRMQYCPTIRDWFNNSLPNLVRRAHKVEGKRLVKGYAIKSEAPVDRADVTQYWRSLDNGDDTQRKGFFVVRLGYVATGEKSGTAPTKKVSGTKLDVPTVADLLAILHKLPAKEREQFLESALSPKAALVSNAGRKRILERLAAGLKPATVDGARKDTKIGATL